MSLQIGIVGLPNVGKSTLFNALTRKAVPCENYPFCTIDPSVGVVAVPDDRLRQLSKFSKSAKTIPAAIEFVDIAGLVKGASKGEGLGNKFLSHIREVDAVAEVVRVFEDPNIIHIDGNPDPVRDIQVINLELILTDLETATKRLASIERDVKKGDKGAAIEKDLLTRIREFLESERMASGVVGANEEEKKILETLQLLTTKPIVYVLNQKSGSKNVDTNSVIEYLKSLGSRYVFVDAGLERDLGDLGEMNEEEKKEYRVSLGAGESGVNELIKKSYETLGLRTVFSAGED